MCWCELVWAYFPLSSSVFLPLPPSSSLFLFLPLPPSSSLFLPPPSSLPLLPHIALEVYQVSQWQLTVLLFAKLLGTSTIETFLYKWALLVFVTSLEWSLVTGCLATQSTLVLRVSKWGTASIYLSEWQHLTSPSCIIYNIVLSPVSFPILSPSSPSLSPPPHV